MYWTTILITYLISSVILGEGLIFYHKKNGQRTSPWEYIIIITIGPLCALAGIITKFRSK